MRAFLFTTSFYVFLLSKTMSYSYNNAATARAASFSHELFARDSKQKYHENNHMISENLLTRLVDWISFFNCRFIWYCGRSTIHPPTHHRTEHSRRHHTQHTHTQLAGGPTNSGTIAFTLNPSLVLHWLSCLIHTALHSCVPIMCDGFWRW